MQVLVKLKNSDMIGETTLEALESKLVPVHFFSQLRFVHRSLLIEVDQPYTVVADDEHHIAYFYVMQGDLRICRVQVDDFSHKSDPIAAARAMAERIAKGVLSQ